MHAILSVNNIVANTSQKHKEKKSQKRKDRQLRREQKQKDKQAAIVQNSFLLQSAQEMKGITKSLPGFLAKNADLICKWLKEYAILFQKADDACIDYLKLMERSKRDELVQDYVDIHTFMQVVKMLKNKNNCAIQSNELSSVCSSDDIQKNESEMNNEKIL